MSYQDESALHGQAAAWPEVSPAPNPSPSSGGGALRPPPPLRPAAQVGGFGGRKKRYLVQKHQQLRCFDPIAQEYVTFAHEREYRAWLKCRFDPKVRSLKAAPAAIAYKRLGKKFATTPLLQWQRASGRTVCLWLKQDWPVEQRRAYEHFSFTHDIDVVLATWDQLDQEEVLIDSLEMARQLMAAAANAGEDLACICEAIDAHMKRYGECTRGELGAQLTCEGCVTCAEHLDAALFHMHANGTIELALDEAVYDDETRICRP